MSREEMREQVARRFIDALQDARMQEPWHWAFRASGLPLCQLQVVWFEMDERLDELPRKKHAYISDFFLNVGTAAHATTQMWLGRLGVLYGHWECPVCGVIHGPSLGPVHCLHPDPGSGGVEAEYKEFAFDDLPTGHCDGLLKLWEMTPGEMDFVLLEVKTTQRNKLEKIKAGDFAFNYRIQASIYAKKLRDRGYNIVDVMFLFIPRDYPRDMLIHWFRPSKAEVIHQSIIEDYNVTLQAIKAGNFGKLTGICGTLEDAKDCPYRVNCFSPVVHKLFADKFHRSYGDPLTTAAFPEFPKG